MKRLLVLALLAAGLAVTPSAASAASGCGTTVFPPAYGVLGYGKAICSTLTQLPGDPRHSERVRVRITCTDGLGHNSPIAVYSAWQWVANTYTANAYCSPKFPIVGSAAYETAIG